MGKRGESSDPSSQLLKLVRLLNSGRMTDSEFQLKVSELIPKIQANDEIKEILKSIDRKHAGRSKFIAQGGLPSLGKRHP